MTKYRIINPNNKEVQEYLSTLSLCKANKFRTMELDNEYGQPLRVILGNSTGTMYYYNGNTVNYPIHLEKQALRLFHLRTEDQ